MFIVEMLRWGDRENHSYVVGVFDSYEVALLCGEAYKSWRGGKYEYCITEHDLNQIEREILNHHKECT